MIDIEELKDTIQGYCAACDTESNEYNEGFQACGMMVLKEIEKLLKEEPVSNDFEKEFNGFLDNVEGKPRMWHSDEQIEWAKDIARHFANWQYQKDRLEFAKLKANVWQDGFNTGAEEKEKQMMSNAVDWVVENWSPEPHPEITVPLNPNKYKMGDKVKLIIIKEY